MHFGQGETIAITMTEDFREMKVPCNSIFLNIFLSESHSGFLWNASVSLIDKFNGLQPKKKENYKMRTLKTLAPLDLMLKVLSDILPVRYIFITSILDWTVFELRTLDAIMVLHSSWICIAPVTAASQCQHHLETSWFLSNVNQSIGFCVIWTLWSKCIVLTSYIFSIYSIYLFICFMLSSLLSIDIINQIHY